MIQEKEEGGEKYLTVETEDDFHEALKRGHPIEVTCELAEKIGLRFEDVGNWATSSRRTRTPADNHDEKSGPLRTICPPGCRRTHGTDQGGRGAVAETVEAG